MNHKLKKEGYYQKYSTQGPTYRYSNHIKRKTALRPARKVDAETMPVVKKMGFFQAKPYDAES